MKILVLNGVNLGMLGKRQPEIYGNKSLKQINRELLHYAAEKNVKLRFFQSDSESELVKKIHRCNSDALIVNAGAYSHYSYAIRDAVAALNIPVVEVHLSDIFAREDFRKVRVLDGVVQAAFWGDGVGSYFKAVDFLTEETNEK